MKMTDREFLSSLATLSADWYKLIPRAPQASLREHLDYRARIINLARADIPFRRLMWRICERDILFFINTFVWTYNPRNRVKVVPMMTWERQDEFYQFIEKNLKETEDTEQPVDIVVPKSRDQGASWMCVTDFGWHWQFHRNNSLLFVSRNEDYVDKPNNEKALFQKIDFMLSRLPKWLVPEYDRVKNNIKNLWTGSIISGESTTGNIAAGDRRTMILLDEFAKVERGDDVKALASSQHATRLRIFNSTPEGVGNAFHRIATSNLPRIKRFDIHWTSHPFHSLGSYQYRDGKIHFFGKGELPPDYPFVTDGKVRSPWYDAECERMPIPSLISQELDISFIGSGSLFFDLGTIEHLRKLNAKPPVWVGNLEMTQDHKPKLFVAKKDGSLKLWIALDHRGMPPPGRYAFGVDISAGTGHSNSVCSIVNVHTGVKVGELCVRNLSPHPCAEMVWALAQAFGYKDNSAYVIWEAPGPGREFGSRIMQLGLTKFYIHKVEDKLAPSNTQKPGFWTNRPSKRMLFSEYLLALAHTKMVNHSDEAYAEMLEYEHGEAGSIVHNPARREEDPSDKGDNHGDRVVADALAALALKELGGNSEDSMIDLLSRAPETSVAHKLAEARLAEARYEENFYNY